MELPKRKEVPELLRPYRDIRHSYSVLLLDGFLRLCAADLTPHLYTVLDSLSPAAIQPEHDVLSLHLGACTQDSDHDGQIGILLSVWLE